MINLARITDINWFENDIYWSRAIQPFDVPLGHPLGIDNIHSKINAEIMQHTLSSHRLIVEFLLIELTSMIEWTPADILRVIEKELEMIDHWKHRKKND